MFFKPPESSQFKEAKDKLRAKDYRGAVTAFEACISAKDNEEKSYYYLAQSLTSLKNFDRALESINKAITFDVNNYQNYYQKGLILVKWCRYPEAYKSYKKVLEHSGNFMEINREWCLCYFLMRRYIDSYNSIKTALFYDDQKCGGDKLSSKRNKTCLLYYLVACNYTDNYNETLQVIENELSKWFPDDPTVIEAQALALCEEKKISELDKLCDKYPKLNNELDYYRAKGKYYNKQYKESMRILDDLVSRTKDKTVRETSYYLKGKINLEKQNKKEAISCFNEALKANEANISIIVDIANWHLKDKEYKLALEVLDRGKKHIDLETQQEFELQWVLARSEALFKMGKMKEGKECFMFVKDTLSKEVTENCFTKTKFITILIKYFEIYHYSEGYTVDDLKYSTNDQIGKGGFSLVYKGTLKNQEVAVKEFKFKPENYNEFENDYEKLNKDIDHMVKYLNLISKEIGTMEYLSRDYHNTLKVLCLYNIDNTLWLITPLCKGGSLYEAFLNTKITKMSLNRKCEILIQIAEALQYMHSIDPPYIHHDIKSLNVLLMEPYNDSKKNKAEVSDFGLTKRRNVYNPGYTKAYASPEILKGGIYDKTIDTYSFGVTVWELMARKAPSSEKTDYLINFAFANAKLPDLENVPSNIQKLVNDCTDSEPNKRPSWSEIISILRKHI